MDRNEALQWLEQYKGNPISNEHEAGLVKKNTRAANIAIDAVQLKWQDQIDRGRALILDAQTRIEDESKDFNELIHVGDKMMNRWSNLWAEEKRQIEQAAVVAARQKKEEEEVAERLVAEGVLDDDLPDAVDAVIAAMEEPNDAE